MLWLKLIQVNRAQRSVTVSDKTHCRNISQTIAPASDIGYQNCHIIWNLACDSTVIGNPKTPIPIFEDFMRAFKTTTYVILKQYLGYSTKGTHGIGNKLYCWQKMLVTELQPWHSVLWLCIDKCHCCIKMDRLTELEWCIYVSVN